MSPLPQRSSPLARRFVRVAALAPYALSSLLPALTPARALLLACWSETLAPGAPEPEERYAFLPRHLGPWLLLHWLRPDAPWLAGAALLLLAALARRAWTCPRRREWTAAATLWLFALPLAGLLAGLAGRAVPPPLQLANPWSWTGVPEPVRAAAAPELAGIEVSDLPLALPSRLAPWPLADSPLRHRAWLWLAMTLAALALATTLGGRREASLSLLGLLLGAGGFLLSGRARGLVLQYQESRQSDEGEGRWLRLEVHASGSDLYDPLRGALLLPPATVQVSPEKEQGLYRVVSGQPWAVVRPGEPPAEATAEPQAWLELHPLRAPRWGGTAAADWLGTLWWWAGGDSGDQGVRWELTQDGQALVRRLLP